MWNHWFSDWRVCSIHTVNPSSSAWALYLSQPLVVLGYGRLIHLHTLNMTWQLTQETADRISSTNAGLLEGSLKLTSESQSLQLGSPLSLPNSAPNLLNSYSLGNVSPFLVWKVFCLILECLFLKLVLLLIF